MSTQVSVQLQYALPAGKAGALITSLFGRQPSQTIREDLRRFKQLLEDRRDASRNAHALGEFDARGVLGRRRKDGRNRSRSGDSESAGRHRKSHDDRDLRIRRTILASSSSASTSMPRSFSRSTSRSPSSSSNWRRAG